MLALAVALWLLVRPYQGIYHDARLYTLQALARLYPESLGQDIFLRFGSQDAFTIFGPAYAAIIRILGVEDAARLMTLVGHAWWFAAAYLIARQLLGRSRATLALAIIAALPGYYGAWDVFQYAEPFITPRLYAEAAVLSAIAALVYRKPFLSVAFAALGMSLHPLMGMGGLLLVVAYATPQRWRRMLLVSFGLGLTAAILISIWAPHYPLARFDAEWLSLVRARSPFILLSDWGAEAWQGAALSLIPLWIFSAGWSDARARALFRSAVAVGAIGIVTTGVGATLFKVVLITQGQGWRWTWVASALLPIAIIGGLRSVWQEGRVERSAVLLALTGWLLIGLPAALLLVLSGGIWAIRARIRGQVARLLFLVCVAIAAIGGILWALSLPSLGTSDPSIMMGRPILRDLQLMLRNGVIGTAIVTIAWFAAPRATSAWLSTAIAASIAAVALWATLPDWRREDYPQTLDPRLEIWRATIPASAEVLWPEDAAAAWFLLQRRSFLSHYQTAGVVFSRRASMEMLRRSEQIRLILPPIMAFGAPAGNKIFRVALSSLYWTCKHSSLDFIVVRQRLAAPLAAPPMLVRHRNTRISEPVYLYDCNQLRPLPDPGSSTRYPEVIG